MQIAISISHQTPLIVAFPCVCMWFLTFFTSLLRIHKNWDVCKFNCLSLTESWEELSISERHRNWTGGKVEIYISKVKEEVWFVMQSQRRRSVVQTLLIDFRQQVFLGIVIFFLPTLYDQNARLCIFFFRRLYSWWNLVSLKGNEKSPYKLTLFIKLLSTVLKELPTPFGKVGKIESCHTLKFYSTDFFLQHLSLWCTFCKVLQKRDFMRYF